MISIFYGLLSALTWGAGDFAGGLSGRKLGAYRAVLFGDFFGLLVLFVAAGIYRENFPTLYPLLIAALAGMLGSMGLFVLYYSMIKGQMSIAAPVSALLAATLPVIVGGMLDGLPKPLQFLGFGFALLAVWMISQGDSAEKFHIGRLADLRLPLLAGLGFGFYFVLMDAATRATTSTFWPMISSRTAGTLLLLVFVVARRESLGVPRNAWKVILINAMLDVSGNLFYILALKTGRLDVSAVLSSLYPGATVLLAWLILKERISTNQWLGIVAALIAIALMTL
ncbi:MAG: DMT family transporter [Chloroflexi bacterium]|nr:DMT family transporter [Chloroflexota bacterium]